MRNKPYNPISFHTHVVRTCADLRLELRRVDELVRLLEIRMEELEKVDRRISVSITVKKQRDGKRGSLDDE